MRMFVISFAIALACLLPHLAEAENWTLPGWFLSVVGIPSVGLGYMTVFFHELGHALTSWSYGQPSVPAFNFVDGGGVAMPLMARSLILQALVYIGAAFAAYLAWGRYMYSAAAALAAVLALHAFFAFGERYLDAVSFMGHGGAVLVGCFCIWRAVTHRTEKSHGVAERYLNMIFGLFAVMDNLVMSYTLMTNDIVRAVYEQGIGGHLTNDLDAIAMRMNTDVPHVAAFSFAFTAKAIIVTAFLCWRNLSLKAEDVLD